MREHQGFPSSSSVEEVDGCLVVHDQDGQALALVRCEDETGRRSSGNLLTRDEALRLAISVAKLPELLRSPSGYSPAPGIKN